MRVPFDKCLKCGIFRWIPIFSLKNILPKHECNHSVQFDPNIPFDELTNYFQDKLHSNKYKIPDVYYDLVSSLEMVIECYEAEDYERTLYYLCVITALIKHCVATDLSLIKAFPETPEDLHD